MLTMTNEAADETHHSTIPDREKNDVLRQDQRQVFETKACCRITLSLPRKPTSLPDKSVTKPAEASFSIGTSPR